MSTAQVAAAAALPPATQGYNDEQIPGVDALQAEKRYGAERAKRLRDDGTAQYIDVSLSDKFRHFHDDPWADPSKAKDLQTMFPENRCQMLVIGAGIGGVMWAISFVQAGIKPEDIRIIDPAGGFGGTWYWNRYPGISCDIESYCYLPFLEETGYIPKKRLSEGDEIREYIEQLAKHWGLQDSAVFQTSARGLAWDEASKEWKAELEQKHTGGESKRIEIRTSFVSAQCGYINYPKLPDLPGILDFSGDVFHSARWNYALSGGSSSDPRLDKFKDKAVAVIGTGSSGIQLAPHVASSAKHLYIVQRTPNAVEKRRQHETDEEWFRKTVATSPGWQKRRQQNFHDHFVLGKQPEVNYVNDSWSNIPTMGVAFGYKDANVKSMEELPAYVEKLQALDLVRMNAVRTRIEKEVNDPEVAEKLKPWYSSWCKRPGMSDEYLQLFNRDNVTLLDTDGKGVERLTRSGIVIGGQELPIDVVVFATGYRGPFAGTVAEKANMTIYGRDGISMTDAWAKNGPTTLHGVIDQNFPNMFLQGPWQATVASSGVSGFVTMSQHCGYILKQARERAGGKPFEVAPTAEATEDWAMQIQMRSLPSAAAAGCTPSYFNMEGEMDRLPMEVKMALAKSGLWGKGADDYADYIKAWRAEGSMKGIEVKV